MANNVIGYVIGPNTIIGTPVRSQSEFLDRAKQRPIDYMSRSPQAQWEIDKMLGILDWWPEEDHR